MAYKEKIQSLNDFISYQLEDLDFEGLVYITPEDMENLKDTLDFDLDNDGVVDRFDLEFRDSKTMT